MFYWIFTWHLFFFCELIIFITYLNVILNKNKLEYESEPIIFLWKIIKERHMEKYHTTLNHSLLLQIYRVISKVKLKKIYISRIKHMHYSLFQLLFYYSSFTIPSPMEFKFSWNKKLFNTKKQGHGTKPTNTRS